MGLLRVFLALVVAVDHTNFAPFGLLPFNASGVAAVLCFFVISGFYMALILQNKYLNIPSGIKLFYLNRILRIYPSYLLVVILTFAMMYVDGVTTITYWAKPDHWQQPITEFYAKLNSFPLWSQVVVWASNLLIIGTNFLDSAAFTSHGSLVFAMVQNNADGTVTVPEILGHGFTNADAFLFFPPAWTLAIELIFYAIAPLLMLRRPIVSIISCAILIYFFPSLPLTIAGPFGSTIICCVMGMLSFFLYQRLPPKRWVKGIGLTMVPVIIGYFLVSNQLPGTFRLKIYFLLGLTWIAIPFIFAAFRSIKFDRMIGELSYALYLSHFLVYKVLVYLLPSEEVALVFYPALGCFAAALTFGLELPLDRYRQKMVEAAKSTFSATTHYDADVHVSEGDAELTAKPVPSSVLE